MNNVILKAGAQLAGTTARSLVQLIPGGNFITLLGEISGTVLENFLADYSDRVLSTKEKEKVGAAFLHAAEKIKSRLDNNERLRTDDYFFANNENYRSSSEEALEGILIKSRFEHEDKKIKHLGYIYANAVFDNYSISEINFYIKLAEQLTYRQICLLSLLFSKEENLSNEGRNYHSKEIATVLQEINGLYQQGLVQMLIPDPEEEGFANGGVFKVTSEGNFHPISSWDEIIPNKIILTRLGRTIYSIMSLEEISGGEIYKLIQLLK
ncbi:hypothetical protein [Paenibacillus sp. NPDC057934]|uniref:hypothetical protein n=1 Tax=Paenibacillus sp. NPDC057934 TaxID=3346282 RepID=UPI0036D8C43B